MDIEYALRNMPTEVRKKVKEIVDRYNKTGDQRYAKMAIEILERFDDSSVRELVRTLKR